MFLFLTMLYKKTKSFISKLVFIYFFIYDDLFILHNKEKNDHALACAIPKLLSVVTFGIL